MKIVLLSLLSAMLASCSAPGFPERRPGDPPTLEVTVARSFTKSR
jgi:hypothetical protein